MTAMDPSQEAPADAAAQGGVSPPDNRFARALASAVAARGMSLEQLRVALAERGSQVSVATLSYWRSGRSRPDRGGSMLALGHLEDVLEVPRGFFASKITPRGPGSAVLEGLPSHYVRRPPDPEVDLGLDRVGRALASIGLSWDDGLTRVSLHDRLEIRPDGTEGRHDVRTVFVAQRDGVDRFPVWYGHDDDGAFPFVAALTNVTLGRVVEFPEMRAVAAEMLLDHPLHLGESMMVEHRLEAIGQTSPSESFLRRLAAPLRELAIEIRYPAECPPRVELHTVRDGDSVVLEGICSGQAARMLEIDPEPGIYGIKWGW